MYQYLVRYSTSSSYWYSTRYRYHQVLTVFRLGYESIVYEQNCGDWDIAFDTILTQSLGVSGLAFLPII
jgi:hypothetical protein